jgi:hypothetical protein
LGTFLCKRTFISFCTDYFGATCETLFSNRKPVGGFIEAIGIVDLFMFVRHFHPVSLNLLWPKGQCSYTPFFVVFGTQQGTT